MILFPNGGNNEQSASRSHGHFGVWSQMSSIRIIKLFCHFSTVESYLICSGDITYSLLTIVLLRRIVAKLNKNVRITDKKHDDYYCAHNNDLYKVITSLCCHCCKLSHRINFFPFFFERHCKHLLFVSKYT